MPFKNYIIVNRRNFIDKSIKGIALGATFGQFSFTQDKINEEYEKLVLLHTNDTHSRLDAFDSGDFKGMGGVAARKTLIDKIRKEEEHVLLVDAGDIFQGTPYFNMFLGELEMFAVACRKKYLKKILDMHVKCKMERI